LLNWVVSSFYVLLPPRRNQDIQNLSLTDSTKNKVDLDNKTIKFNIFKTSKTTDDDDKVIKISDDLINVIKYWMKMTGIKTGDLLVGFNNKELNQVNSINRILNKIYKVGSSDLRHIYLSSKYGNTLEEMKNDSKIMAHNTDTQRDYIKL
jgi:integrase